MDKVVSWLFSNPTTGEPFHFYVPWMIFCGLGLLIPFYYAFEGRKRFFGHHTLHKYLMSKFMNHLWPLALVGWILIGARYAELGLFSWRFWRYGWLLWLAIILVYWGLYFTRRYSGHLDAYKRERTMAQYLPQPNARKRAARAGNH